MTGRTTLAGEMMLDLVERLNSGECQCGCVHPTHEEIATELRTRLTRLGDELDLPGIVMDRRPIRILVLGDELKPGAWSIQRVLR